MAAELLTAAQVAARLDLKPSTIFTMFRQGKIPGLKVSWRIVRFDWTDVVAALKDQPARRRSKITKAKAAKTRR